MAYAYLHLDLEDRRRIYRLHAKKLSVDAIARELGRHRSTIFRELRRNAWSDPEHKAYNGYFPVTAQDLARDRRRRQRKLLHHSALRDSIVDRLEHGWSPEQIAGRLKRDGLGPVRVCTETIYQFVYSKEGRDQLLHQHLAERRRARRRRGARKARGPMIPAQYGIANRPALIAERRDFGHWEGDLMIFRREFGKTNLTSLVERTSRYTLLMRNLDRQSMPLMEQIIVALASLPAGARQSFTFDRGTEFMAWRRLKDGLGADTWFCDPSAPWQKGTVENTNGRLRRYLPRSTDLIGVRDRGLRELCHRLNSTPRRCLDFQTPAEVFAVGLQRLGH
jgi:IS30 family transposase